MEAQKYVIGTAMILKVLFPATGLTSRQGLFVYS